MIEHIPYRKEEEASSEDEPPSMCMDPIIQIQTVVDEKLGIIVSDYTKELVRTNYPDHVYQKLGSGWCGPAVISRIFRKAGISMDQEAIAMAILSDGKPLYDEKWGSSHSRISEFLKMYFEDVDAKKDSSIEAIKQYLFEGKEIIANVRAMDDAGEDGHYVAVTKIDSKNGFVEIHDPTNAIRADGLHGVYTLSFKKFLEEWWDYATPEDEENGIKTFKWIAYTNPLSIKLSAISQHVVTL